jgi:hypothetical protein
MRSPFPLQYVFGKIVFTFLKNESNMCDKVWHDFCSLEPTKLHYPYGSPISKLGPILEHSNPLLAKTPCYPRAPIFKRRNLGSFRGQAAGPRRPLARWPSDPTTKPYWPSDCGFRSPHPLVCAPGRSLIVPNSSVPAYGFPAVTPPIRLKALSADCVVATLNFYMELQLSHICSSLWWQSLCISNILYVLVKHIWFYPIETMW